MTRNEEALIAMLREAVEYLHIHASNLAFDDNIDDAKDVRVFCGSQPGSKDVLLFAVPVKSDGCRQPEIPPSFVEITYGQFYDLTNTGVVL